MVARPREVLPKVESSEDVMVRAGWLPAGSLISICVSTATPGLHTLSVVLTVITSSPSKYPLFS